MKSINVLIPIAGKSKFFDEDGGAFPKPLVEINGIPMIQYAIDTLNSLKDDKKFIFVIRQEHSLKFHLGYTLKLLTNEDSTIIEQRGDTKGAACSCLLAIEHINNDHELIISNGDQKVESNLTEIVQEFRNQKADAGVILFESVHPQWSYVKFDEAGQVCEAAEKKPISKNAIAGFYYFRKGSDFVSAAKNSILKGADVNGLFFIAPTLNEFILRGQKVSGIKIPNDRYHSFYSVDKIKAYQD